MQVKTNKVVLMARSVPRGWRRWSALAWCSPATVSAEGAQLNGRPFPASVTAEGAQLNGRPFPASVTAEGAQLNGRPSPSAVTRSHGHGRGLVSQRL